MFSHIVPVTVAQNVDAGETNGRALFSVLTGEPDANNVPLFIGNLVELERDPTTPDRVRSTIEGIWDCLSVEDCFVTPDLLRKVLDRAYENGSFIDLVAKCTTKGKLGLAVRNLVSKGTKRKGGDLLESFLNSNLGIMMLRHIIDLPWQNMRQMKQNVIGEESINALDRSFLESPTCCLYVKGLTCSLLGNGQTQSAYMRTKPRFKFGIPSLFNRSDSCLPQQTSILGVNEAKTDHCYIYGQMTSGFTGFLGNLYSDAQEFAARKDAIVDAWNNRESFAKQSGNQYIQPKWYDNYAGQDSLTKASYHMVVLDAPPHSKLSTLAAMKRNIILFLCMCKGYLACEDRVGNNDEEDFLEDMAEAIGQYFISGINGMTGTKCPLRVSSSTKSPYMKMEESVVGKHGASYGSRHWVSKLQRMGVSKEKIQMFEQLTEGGYHHIPFVNVLSGVSLTERERVSLNDPQEESDSLVVVPLSPYAYMSIPNTTGEPPKLIGGIRYQLSPFQNMVTPVYVCKSSLLYGRKNLAEAEHGSMIEEDVRKISQRVMMLCGSGMSREEAFSILSLDEEKVQVIEAFLDADIQEPEAKRQRTV